VSAQFVEALRTKDAVTNGELRNHQGTLPANIIFHFARQIEELDSTERFLLHEKGDGIVRVNSVLAVVIRVTGRRRVVHGEVVGLHNREASNLLDLTVAVRTAVAGVVEEVQQLIVVDEAVVRRRRDNEITLILRDVMLVELLSRRVGRINDVLNGRRCADVRRVSVGLIDRALTDTSHVAASLDRQRQEVPVVGLSKRLTHLVGVLGANVEVRNRLVNASDEGIRNEQIIDGDDLLILLELSSGDFSTRRVVVSRSFTNCGNN